MKHIKFFIFLYIFIYPITVGIYSAEASSHHQDPNAFLTSEVISKSLKFIPVQYNGRIQPFDTFAKNSLRFIYGHTRFNQKPAIDIILSWILVPEFWMKEKFVRIDDASLRKTLKLNTHTHLFSPHDILNNKIFIQEINTLRTLQQNKEDLNSHFKAIQKLENRLFLFIAVQRGEAPGWIPSLHLENKKTWLSLSHLEQVSAAKSNNSSSNILDSKSKQYFQKAKEAFQKLISAYVAAVSPKEDSISEKTVTLKKAVSHFQTTLKEDPSYEKHLSKSSIEVHYNHLNPFRWAWILYLIGLVWLLLRFVYPLQVVISKNTYHKYVRYISLGSLLSAFCLHGYGMLLRSLIMGRPPVTNMYETVLWVPWVSFILGLVLWRVQKFFTALVCASVVALFCLLLADQVPSLLDGRLEPLEAVLRSNFWLSTHVLIITMSYSAFFLAFVLGDTLLFFFLKNKYQKHIPTYVKSIDRCIQVGVVLLATGTVLGGIWADYSWGRFWGWDPKETWALIGLLGYLALLHGRLLGWIKEFGLAVGAVLVFFLIVMAWYGVNYVLGQGLHSYGFGSGGVEYVTGFALLHLVYVLVVWALKSQKS